MGARSPAPVGIRPTARERRTTLAAAAVGLVLASLCAAAAGAEWDVLQRSVVLFVAFDLFGGIAALSMRAGINRYRPEGRPLRPVTFAALHIHPFALATAVPEVTWPASVTAYALTLAAVFVTSLADQEYRAGLSLILCTLAVSGTTICFNAPGLEWFASAFYLKLIGTFAVQVRE